MDAAAVNGHEPPWNFFRTTQHTTTRLLRLSGFHIMQTGCFWAQHAVITQMTKETPLEGRHGESGWASYSSRLYGSFTRVRDQTCNDTTQRNRRRCWRAYDNTRFNKRSISQIFFNVLYVFRLYMIYIWYYVVTTFDFFGLGLPQRGSLNINLLWGSCCFSSYTEKNTKTLKLQRKELDLPINQFIIPQDGENMDDSPNINPLLHIQFMFPDSQKPLQSLI